MHHDDTSNEPVCTWVCLGGGSGQRWDCALSLTDDLPPLAAADEPTDPDAYCAWGNDTPFEDLPEDLPDDWFTGKP